jgi:hypothetical protein
VLQTQQKEESMRRKIAVLVAGVAAVAVVSATALAVIPGETPFPSPKIESVFVSTHTVTGPASPLGANVLSNYYPRGSTVVFKVFAADTKSGKVLTADDVKYAYVVIPGQPNVKLTYTAPVTKDNTTWLGSWTVPADYPTGLVQFVTRFRTTGKLYGNFVQLPVATSQLTVTK